MKLPVDQELAKSLKRLVDLIYIWTFIWGIGSAIQWIAQYGQ